MGRSGGRWEIEGGLEMKKLEGGGWMQVGWVR